MADRIDHFQGMRGEQEPQAEPDAGAPTATPELADYLAKIFPDMKAQAFDGTMDGIISHGLITAQTLGQQQVIAHLRSLVRGA